MRFKVCIVQHRLLHYRTAMFEQLRASCAAAGIDLSLVHGQPTPAESLRQDTAVLPWAISLRNRSLRISGRDWLWQPLQVSTRDTDLVVLMQESRLLSNYPWLLGWGPRHTRVAYWGHGRNFQSAAPAGWRERWKRLMLGRVDWWFAYTEATRAIVEAAAYPRQRITVLNNAIDNSRFAAELAAISAAQVAALRQSIGAGAGSVVGVYCGSLYPDKRLPLLLEACAVVAAQRPDFRLVVMGDGPSRDVLRRAANSPWLHWVGVRRGPEKAAWFRAAQLYLSPGAVGLHVLDSFVAGLPLITTDDALHGPEIAYLLHDENSLICPGNSAAYAQTVLALMGDLARRDRISAAARAAAEQYTLASMVERFTQGMLACLQAPRL